MKSKWLLMALALLTLGTSCGREFDPYWRILDFRVLALRTSEPELRPGETAVLDALVYVPDGEEVEYQWEWCPFRTQAGDAFECPFTKEELNAFVAEGGDLPEGFELPIPDFDLGTEPTAELNYPATPELIQLFCESLQESLADAPPQVAALVPVVDCDRGLEVSIRLVARSGGEEIISGKRMNIWTQAELENNNPDVQAIEIRPLKVSDAEYLIDQGLDWVAEPVDDIEEWWVPIPDEGLDIYGGVPLEFRAVVRPESIDLWTPPAPQGSGEDFLPIESEVVVYRWMTTAGSYDESEKLFKEGLNTLEASSVTEYRIDECPDNEATCDIKIWAITRDGRLGTDWIERDLRVVGRR